MEDYLSSHILDLAFLSQKSGRIMASEFLGVSEQGLIAPLLGGETIQGSPYLLFGGHPDSERNLILFFPDEAGKDEFLQNEETKEEAIRCLRISPSYSKEEKQLGHRDYLGALMSLGIKRETIGDILYEGTTCYVYLTPMAAQEALDGLDSVGRIPMHVEQVALDECRIQFKKEEIRLSVSSLRLDNVVSAVAHVSREDGKNLILGDRVHLSLHPIPKPDTLLAETERVSIEGWGKFRFLGQMGTSKKGKYVILVERFL